MNLKTPPSWSGRNKRISPERLVPIIDHKISSINISLVIEENNNSLGWYLEKIFFCISKIAFISQREMDLCFVWDN